MAQQQQAFTIPHDLDYRCNEPPKTPEREVSSAADQIYSPARSSRSGFRVRRRRGHSSMSSQSSEMIAEDEPQVIDALATVEETALPSIEVSEQHEIEQVPDEQPPTVQRFLTPFQQAVNDLSSERSRRACTPVPRTSIQEPANFKRPSSPLSGLSDSEDEACSLIGSEDGNSNGGSVTSIESEAADPFQYGSMRGPFRPDSPRPQYNVPRKCWTKEMDEHLWSVYSNYLDDPTITPFKTLPGCPPPQGVCHRVASEARKSWKSRTAPSQIQADDDDDVQDAIVLQRPADWPGQGSATRSRLRKLCRRQAQIIPHYQRMVRSPSPRPEGPRVQITRDRSPVPLHTPGGTYIETSGPSNNTDNMIVTDTFATRDVAMMLLTSTSATMQPSGPLAQLTSEAYQDEILNQQVQHPEVMEHIDLGSPAWADDTQDAEAVEQTQDVQDAQATGVAINRLRSPFAGSNTWGPSNLQALEQVRAAGRWPTLAGRYPDAEHQAPRLGSPVQFDTTSPPTRMPKRPATSELGDDEVSNGRNAARRLLRDDLLSISFKDASRRLRLRGMSLDAQFAENDQRYMSEPTTFIGSPPSQGNEVTAMFASLPPGIIPGVVRPVPLEDPFQMDPPLVEPAPRLRSPFPGIGIRPSRGRHASSHSLPSVAASDLESIDQRVPDDIPE